MLTSCTKSLSLDCGTCRDEAKILGVLIVLPTLLGVLFALFMYLSTVSMKGEIMNVSLSYQGIAGGSAFNLLYPLGIGLCSFAVGSIGWLVIMKNKAYRCVSCRQAAHDE